MAPDPADARPERDRLTPYALTFAETDFEAVRFPQIREQSEAADPPVADPEDFLRLPAVTGLLRELLPADAPGHAVDEYGRLVYHAYEHWRSGLQVLDLDPELARFLVRPALRIGEWEPVSPWPAGYAQLPRNLFWARAEESRPPEPVDGFFWAVRGAHDPAEPPLHRLDLLFVLGVRPGRPGYSVVAAAAELGDLPTGHWGDAEARPEGPDFGNILPGGEIENLYALVTETEALKLASRIFWYAAEHADALEEAGGADRAAGREAVGGAGESEAFRARGGGEGKAVRTDEGEGRGGPGAAGGPTGERIHRLRLVEE